MRARLEWIFDRLLWLFAVYRRSTVQYGTDQAYDHLTGLLTLAAATSASFALAVNQIVGAEWIASLFYLIITVTIVVLIAIIINSPSTAPPVVGTVLLRMDRSTVLYGRFVSGLSLLLAMFFVFSAQVGWFPGQESQRKDYTGTEIKLGGTWAAGTQPRQIDPAGIFQDPATEDAQLVDRFKSWFALQGLDNNQRIFIVEQHPAFDAAYNTFSAVLLHPQREVVFKDALVFLKRRPPGAGGGSVKYTNFGWRWGDAKEAVKADLEQLRTPRNQSGSAYPVITIPKPDVGDSLLIFLRMEFAKDSKFVSDPSGFEIQLRRVQR